MFSWCFHAGLSVCICIDRGVHVINVQYVCDCILYIYIYNHIYDYICIINIQNYRYYPCIVQIWKEPEEVCTNPNSRQVAKQSPAPSRCQPRDNCAAENFPVSSLAAEPLVPNGAHGDRTGAQFAIQNLVSLVLDVIWCYSLQSSTFWEVNHLSRCHISHPSLLPCSLRNILNMAMAMGIITMTFR